VSETSYVVSGASDGSPDTFEVRARDAAGNHSLPAALTSDLLIKPTMPGAPVASNITSTSALLTWRPSTDTAGVKTYWIALNGAAPVLSAQNNYLFTDLKDGTPYTVVVNAVSAAGIVSNPSSGTFRTLDATKPTQPSGLVAIEVSSRAVAFIWTRASDNVGVTHYEILEAGSVIATTQDSAPAFLATGLTAGTLYSFAVQALDAAGNRSEPSLAITVKTAPLGAPKNARTTVSHNRIDLVWDRPDDAIGLLGYRVEVTNHNGSDRKVETPARSVGLSLLKPSTEYTVSISAHDASQFYGEALTFKVTTKAN
jgi:chitodextrinase